MEAEAEQLLKLLVQRAQELKAALQAVAHRPRGADSGRTQHFFHRLGNSTDILGAAVYEFIRNGAFSSNIESTLLHVANTTLKEARDDAYRCLLASW